MLAWRQLHRHQTTFPPNHTKAETLEVWGTKGEISIQTTASPPEEEETKMGPAHPDICLDSGIPSRFQPNQTSASASAGGYPPQK
ncbi:hypothetical protein PGT21_030223 [Puccinia graminis f. sp. tritici]|uniref:Uncharacterized protein n=1 Tax=Puccinia graminis f. sp. tritici TaxID=56615 RepID=A0A5B0N9Q8_PUCGR|nr:hypothetical protein PGT21_030223 [Puccinia graminis f. sp. tritici]